MLIVLSTVSASAQSSNCGSSLAPQRHIWTPQDYEVILKALDSSGLPLNQATIRNDSRVTEVVSSILNRPATGMSFYISITRRYHGWDNALRVFGYDAGKVRKKFFGSISQETLIKGLTVLHREGFSTNFDEMNKNVPGSNETIYQAIGISLTTRALMKRLLVHFDDWQAALDAAGLPVADIVRGGSKVEWTPQLLKEVLRFLNSHYPNMSVTRLTIDELQVKRLTFQRFKMVLAPRYIYKACREIFGGWNEALAAADIHQDIKWSRELIIGLLSFLKSKRINLYYDPFLQRTGRVRQLLLNEYGSNIGAYTIWREALSEFGSWRAAIRAANFELPIHRRREKEKRKPSAKSNLPLISYVEFYEKDETGQLRRHRQMGETVDPENELIKSDQDERVRSAIHSLDERGKRLASALLDYLDEFDDLSDQRKAVKYLSAHIGQTVEWEDVRQILASLSGELEDSELD